jgi:hypothetical protein
MVVKVFGWIALPGSSGGVFHVKRRQTGSVRGGRVAGREVGGEGPVGAETATVPYSSARCAPPRVGPRMNVGPARSHGHCFT